MNSTTLRTAWVSNEGKVGTIADAINLWMKQNQGIEVYDIKFGQDANDRKGALILYRG